MGATTTVLTMTQPIHFDPNAQGPLRGTRVVDLSRLVAGNMLSLQLADFGADVIKVEPPEGDPLRQWKDEGHALFWKIYGRNKRSLVLNLREPAGMAALKALLNSSDVFIENFRPGTLEQMGLAPDTLLMENPRLIIVRISGFGQTGPYAHLPGFGSIVEGMSGFAHRNGFADREPVLPPLALADMIAGLYGASSVVTALLARDRGLAQGQVIDLSLLEPIVSVLGPEAALFELTGKTKMRSGSASNTSSPRNVYRCRDGRYLAVSGSTPQIARRILDVIGRADMLDDPRFRSNEDRVRHRELVDAAVGAWFAEHDHDEALEIMRGAGATVGPIFSPADAAADPHFVERGVTIEAEDADYGQLPMHNIVPRLSATPGVWRRPAPKLGEHNDEILAEIGMTI